MRLIPEAVMCLGGIVSRVIHRRGYWGISKL